VSFRTVLPAFSFVMNSAAISGGMPGGAPRHFNPQRDICQHEIVQLPCLGSIKRVIAQAERILNRVGEVALYAIAISQSKRTDFESRTTERPCRP